MNNLYKRPMFRKGGSAEGGITSGLGRPGYAENGSVEELTTEEKILQDAGDQGTMSTRDRMLKAVGAQPSKQNFNDFLINFGLNMASNAPSGNIFQTAAAQAKDPYADFSKANQAEQNLLRQVGLEGASLDIKNEADIAAAQLKAENTTGNLKMQLDAAASENKIARELLKDAEKKEYIANYMSDNGGSAVQAGNMYEFYNNTTNKSQFSGLELGGEIPQSTILLGAKELRTWIKNNKKNNASLNKIYINSSTGDIYKMIKDDDIKGGLNVEIVGNTGGGSVPVGDKDYGEADSTKEFGDAEITLVTPQGVNFENKPVFETMAEVRSVIKFPMTGKEIIQQYALSEDVARNLNPRLTYTPYKEGDPFFKVGVPFK